MIAYFYLTLYLIFFIFFLFNFNLFFFNEEFFVGLSLIFLFLFIFITLRKFVIFFFFFKADLIYFYFYFLIKILSIMNKKINALLIFFILQTKYFYILQSYVFFFNFFLAHFKVLNFYLYEVNFFFKFYLNTFFHYFCLNLTLLQSLNSSEIFAESFENSVADTSYNVLYVPLKNVNEFIFNDLFHDFFYTIIYGSNELVFFESAELFKGLSFNLNILFNDSFYEFNLSILKDSNRFIFFQDAKDALDFYEFFVDNANILISSVDSFNYYYYYSHLAEFFFDNFNNYDIFFSSSKEVELLSFNVKEDTFLYDISNIHIDTTIVASFSALYRNFIYLNKIYDYGNLAFFVGSFRSFFSIC
jgi:hypothetical protein